MSLADFELRIARLDRLLQPIARRPVDITKPGWASRLRQQTPPLDEAGIRDETEALLEELISYYQTINAEDRASARGLFTKYRAFAWAACSSENPTTEEGFRRKLLLFSLKDQGSDSRDALLLLQDLCRQARVAGVHTATILTSIAELSSDVDKYGMGSTRHMLLKAL
jgi:hypothetical protein